MICDVQTEYAECLFRILTDRLSGAYQFHLFADIDRAVEFARRGFVVLSVDLYGSGDSENSAESFASMAMLTSVTDTFYEHMLNRDYVDKDNILIGAHSMGGSVAAGLAGKYQPKGVMSASGALGGQFNGVEGAEERVEMIGTYVGDVLLDFGDVERDEASLCSLVQDWLDSRVGYDGYEGVEYTQVGQIAGSFEEGNAVVGLTSHEGRKHQVKKMLQAVGHRVLRLHRDAFGPLALSGVSEGSWRELSEDESRALAALVARGEERHGRNAR